MLITLYIHNAHAHAVDADGKILCKCGAAVLGQPRSKPAPVTVSLSIPTEQLCADSLHTLRKHLVQLQNWAQPQSPTGQSISAALAEIDSRLEKTQSPNHPITQ